jgi:hypothetical protein
VDRTELWALRERTKTLEHDLKASKAAEATALRMGGRVYQELKILNEEHVRLWRDMAHVLGIMEAAVLEFEKLEAESFGVTGLEILAPVPWRDLVEGGQKERLIGIREGRRWIDRKREELFNRIKAGEFPGIAVQEEDKPAAEPEEKTPGEVASDPGVRAAAENLEAFNGMSADVVRDALGVR